MILSRSIGTNCGGKKLIIKNIRMQFLKLALLLLISSPLAAQDYTPLFNGRDLSGWYSFLKTKGKGNDPDTVFSVKDGLLKITGKEFGYIVTERSFTDFHLIVEFKWGEKKYPPRETRVRDNGILYYVVPEDRVWPRSIECQIQEG